MSDKSVGEDDMRKIRPFGVMTDFSLWQTLPVPSHAEPDFS
jgi:hypothetical protein